jgi:hypothetical protein
VRAAEVAAKVLQTNMHLLLALALVQGPSASISGTVVDSSGGALTGATIAVTCGTRQATAVSDSSGRYRVDALPAARCRATAVLDGFTTGESVIDLTTPSSGTLNFRLAVHPFAQQIVVTPSRGIAEPTTRVAQAASMVDRSALETRPYAIVTQVLREEVGVMAQQTTSAQGSPVLRGFTGQRNLYLLDGVRYNTAAVMSITSRSSAARRRHSTAAMRSAARLACSRRH